MAGRVEAVIPAPRHTVTRYQPVMSLKVGRTFLLSVLKDLRGSNGDVRGFVNFVRSHLVEVCVKAVEVIW